MPRLCRLGVNLSPKIPMELSRSLRTHQGDAGKSRWQWNSRVKGLPRIGFYGEIFTRWSSVTAPSSRSRAARSSGSLPLDRATALKVREQRRHYCRRCSRAQQGLACHLVHRMEPSMKRLRPVDRTSGTLTLSAGTLSCLAHHGTPLSGRCPRRPRWNTRQCRWTMRIVCLHWERSSPDKSFSPLSTERSV